jgi:hypothetical protein
MAPSSITLRLPEDGASPRRLRESSGRVTARTVDPARCVDLTARCARRRPSKRSQRELASARSGRCRAAHRDDTGVFPQRASGFWPGGAVSGVCSGGYNNPLNKVDPLGLRPGDCQFELDLYDSSRSGLQGAQSHFEGMDVPGWAQGDVDDKIAQIADLLSGCRQFIKADPANDGRVIEVHGSLQASRHVGIHVAAGGVHFGNFSGFSATGGGLQNAANSANVSIISWMDYNPPDPVSPTKWPQYVFGRPTSEDGGESLARLVRVLKSKGRDVTLIGHSFAGNVVGNAMHEQGAQPDRAVYFGADLWSGTAAAGLDVYWGMAGNDGLKWILPGAPSGAQVISTQGVSGHGDYFSQNNHAGRNLMAIVKGNTQACAGNAAENAMGNALHGCVIYAG